MRKTSILIVALALAAGGCVSKSKHEATLGQLKTCQGTLDSTTGERDGCKKDLAQSQQKVADLEGELATTRQQRDTAAAAQKDADDKLTELTYDLKATNQELDELRKQKAEAEKRLAAQKKLTERFRKMVDAGKVQIVLRGGLMIMKLPSGVLFASGKADLSPEGKAVLTEVAAVLKEFPDRKFVIGGHTDNVPLKGSKYKDNWELATARALTVTKFLIEQGVSPKSLSAAGYGEFDPIADNGTDEGRQENRRIEIILVPNIDELPVDEGTPQ
jgi:chemotaxis protein MotB